MLPERRCCLSVTVGVLMEAFKFHWACNVGNLQRSTKANGLIKGFVKHHRRNVFLQGDPEAGHGAPRPSDDVQLHRRPQHDLLHRCGRINFAI